MKSVRKTVRQSECKLSLDMSDKTIYKHIIDSLLIYYVVYENQVMNCFDYVVSLPTVEASSG